MYTAAQSERLQRAIDALPECFFAEDMEDVTSRFARIFRNVTGGSSNEREMLASQCAGLELVGKQLYQEGGDGPNPAHSMIAGLYCKGSDGYTRFLRAYAGAFRAWDDIIQQGLNASNWASELIDGTKDFLKDIGAGAKGLIEGAGDATGNALWESLKPVFILVGVILVAIVLIAFFTKGKISLS